MSVIDTLAAHARHRRLTRNQLMVKLGRLEAEADNLVCELVALTTENDAIKSERNQLEQQLDTAGIELSGVREDLAEAEQELTELRAFKANVLSVSDLSAQSGPAAPAPTADRFNDGPVVRIGVRPETDSETTQSMRAVTDPGQTGWGARNERQGVAS